jgi:hypothetical protein
MYNKNLFLMPYFVMENLTKLLFSKHFHSPCPGPEFKLIRLQKGNEYYARLGCIMVLGPRKPHSSAIGVRISNSTDEIKFIFEYDTTAKDVLRT